MKAVSAFLSASLLCLPTLASAQPGPPPDAPPIAVGGSNLRSHYLASDHAYDTAESTPGQVSTQIWTFTYETSDAHYQITQAHVALSPSSGSLISNDIEDLTMVLPGPLGEQCELANLIPKTDASGATFGGSIGVPAGASLSVETSVTEGAMIEFAGADGIDARWDVDFDDGSTTAANRVFLDFFAKWRCPKVEDDDFYYRRQSWENVVLAWEIDDLGFDQDWWLGWEGEPQNTWDDEADTDTADSAALHEYVNPETGSFQYAAGYRVHGDGGEALDHTNLLGYVATTPAPGTTALHAYLNQLGSYYYTTDLTELGEYNNGWSYQGILGHVWTDSIGNGRTLYRYKHTSEPTYRFTSSWKALGEGNLWWRYDGIVGYLASDFRAPPPAGILHEAEMLSPLPGSTLAGREVRFVWSNARASETWLSVGTSVGDASLFNASTGTETSVDVAGLPTDAHTSRIYTRVWTLRGGSWSYLDYTYGPAKATAVRIATPIPQSKLPGQAVTFAWPNKLGKRTWLQLGTAIGGTDLFNADQGTKQSAVVKHLPTSVDAYKVYARLWTQTDGFWDYVDTSYLAATFVGSQLSFPAAGSTLLAHEIEFSWNALANRQYWLYVGTSKGDNSLHNASSTAASVKVAIPRSVDTLWTRMWTQTKGQWQFTDRVYSMLNSSAPKGLYVSMAAGDCTDWPDSDGDGIADEIDIEPNNPSDAFSGPPPGTIDDRGGNTVTVTPAPGGGVRIETCGGEDDAVVTIMGVTIEIAPGTIMIVVY